MLLPMFPRWRTNASRCIFSFLYLVIITDNRFVLFEKDSIFTGKKSGKKFEINQFEKKRIRFVSDSFFNIVIFISEGHIKRQRHGYRLYTEWYERKDGFLIRID